MPRKSLKPRHDPVTGALLEEPEKPPHSASGYERYLKSDTYKDHPFGYLSQIHAFVAPLGGGKSTAIYGVLQELEAIIDPKHMGRTLYYTGSRSDKLLESYDPSSVEIYSPESKESFLGEVRTMLSDAADRAERKRRGGEKGEDKKKGDSELTMDKREKKEESEENDDETPPHHIIVLDDACTDADLLPTSMKTDSPVQRLMMSTRHIPCTILISAQKMCLIPTFVRANAAHWYLFGSHSDSERRDLEKVVNFSKKEFIAAMDNLTKRGEFLWVSNSSRTICKNFVSPVVH